MDRHEQVTPSITAERAKVARKKAPPAAWTGGAFCSAASQRDAAKASRRLRGEVRLVASAQPTRRSLARARLRAGVVLDKRSPPFFRFDIGRGPGAVQPRQSARACRASGPLNSALNIGALRRSRKCLRRPDLWPRSALLPALVILSATTRRLRSEDGRSAKDLSPTVRYGWRCRADRPQILRPPPGIRARQV